MKGWRARGGAGGAASNHQQRQTCSAAGKKTMLHSRTASTPVAALASAEAERRNGNLIGTGLEEPGPRVPTGSALRT